MGKKPEKVEIIKPDYEAVYEFQKNQILQGLRETLRSGADVENFLTSFLEVHDYVQHLRSKKQVS